MIRLLPVLFSCAIFIACSSDDSSSLKEWFNDQRIAASYGKEYFETELSIESVKAGFDSSAFMVSSFAALGNVNGIEHTLYFGLVAHDSVKHTWSLRTDSLFYRDKLPLESREISARLYWLPEDSLETDISSWLKFEKDWEGFADISFTWQARNALDSFTINLPPELLEVYRGNMLLGLKLLSDDIVLRIAPPRISDIDGLIRVGQKSKELEACETCLYAGVMDSINISFGINENILPNETVVFAQIFIPKTDSEFEKHNIPLYAYNEVYRMDTALIYDSLKFQVTTKLRRYTAPDSLNFTLRFGNPMLPEKVFAPRPDYAKYDFANAVGKNAKLKIWYAQTD